MSQLKKPNNEEIADLFNAAPSWAEYISFDSDGYQQWHYSKPKHSIDDEYYSQHGIPVTDNIDDSEHHLFASCVVRRPSQPTHPNLPGFFYWFKKYRQNKKKGRKMKTRTITQPTTPDGTPTCSSSPSDNCVFLQSKYGQYFSCFWLLGANINRGGADRLGYLVPCKGCFFGDDK